MTFRFRSWTENTDWRAGILEQTLTIIASVRKMGGLPTVEELKLHSASTTSTSPGVTPLSTVWRAPKVM